MTCIVYEPGARLRSRAESALGLGRAKAPDCAVAAAIAGALPPVVHPVFVAIGAPEVSKTVTTGLARSPLERPYWASVGPTPRRRTSVCEPAGPAITKPWMRMLAPVPTWARLETFASLPGLPTGELHGLPGKVCAIEAT